jgi:ubiquinone/menaquinone biosynthesis C-methylase UbiE
MSEASRTFVPAAGRNWTLPLYDPLVRLMGGGSAMAALLEQADLEAGQRVLDVGCGTGTLAIMTKRLHTAVEVFGLDPDPQALARARRKAERGAVVVHFDLGFGDDLPYPDASFHHVFSSLMFHHLPAQEKVVTLRDIRRVLRPGGSLHLLDFEGPEAATEGLLPRLLHSSRRLEDNAESRVVELMSQAGFCGPEKVGRRAMGFARVAYFRAHAQGGRSAGGGIRQARDER